MEEVGIRLLGRCDEAPFASLSAMNRPGPLTSPLPQAVTRAGEPRGHRHLVLSLAGKFDVGPGGFPLGAHDQA